MLAEQAAEVAGDARIILDRPFDIAPERGTGVDVATLASLVAEASGWLRASGVHPWDRVAIMKRNHLDNLVLAYAAARLGAIPALLSPRLDAGAVEVMLGRLGAGVVVTDLGVIAAIGRDVLAGATRRVLSVDGAAPGVIALDDVRGAPVPPPSPRSGGEAMVITHTSGTTGIPKLVQHSVDTVSALVRVETRRYPGIGLRRDDVCGVCVAYVHGRAVTGLAAVLHARATLVALSEPSPDAVRSLLGRHRPTIVESHPNIYMTWEDLAEDASHPFADVRLFINTFDAIHPRTVRVLLDASRRRFPLWAQGWGQSEIGPATIGLYTRRSLARDRSSRSVTRDVGWPVPLTTRVRVVDPVTGRRVRRGVPGLVEVRSPARCVTYVGEAERHADKCRDGWWNMGDLGERTRRGSLRLLDREVDRIPGASSIELEDVLIDRLPGVTEVVVLGVPGGPPVPVVSTRDDHPLDPEQWSAATAGLPSLAPPVYVRWDEIPRTGTWKVRRFALREQVLEDTATVGTGRWT